MGTVARYRVSVRYGAGGFSCLVVRYGREHDGQGVTVGVGAGFPKRVAVERAVVSCRANREGRGGLGFPVSGRRLPTSHRIGLVAGGVS